MTFTGALRPFQEEAFERMVERKRLLVGYEMGLGKSQDVDMPVLTPSGWRRIGDLEVGDYVIGQDGKPTEVLGVFPQGEREMVRVTMQDGSWADCDWDHLWAVSNPASRRRGVWRTYTTRELAQGVTTDRWGNKRFLGGLQLANGNNRYQIPMVEPVHYDPVELPVDPYALGLLLGDGSFSLPKTRFSGLPESWLQAGFEGWVTKAPRTATDCTDWYLDMPVIEKWVDSWGLRGRHSWDKFVPEPYLRGSPEQRLALLQGLLDSDGHAMYRGGAEFCSASPALVDAVVEIVRSLGGVARGRRVTDSTYTHKGEKRKGRRAERVNLKLPPPYVPFRLAAKVAAYVVPTKYPPTRAVVSIEPVGVSEAVCIAVAAPDQLYVTKDFLVTHNTVLSIATIEHLLDEGLVQGGLVVVPSSLKYQWLRSIDQFTDEATALVVDGTPAQRREQYAEIADGGVEYAILNYEQVVNDWDEVRHLPRDFVILDEAQAIKNFAAKRTKRIKKLTSRYRFALSGQPVENRPEEVFSIMQWVDEDVLGRFDKFDKTFVVRNHWGGVKYYRALPLLHKTLGEAMVRKTRQDPDVRDQMPDVTEEILDVDFDRAGASLYRHIARDLQQELASALGSFGKGFDLASHYGGEASAEENAARGRIMSRLTCLRMLCDHPDLLRISATKYEATMGGEGMAGGSAYAQELLAAGLLDKKMGSPKMKATLDLIEDLLTANPANKVVVFAFFKDMLSMLADGTAHLAKSVLFTGDMSPQEKDAAQQTFKNDPECRLFLSSDAGGYGVDLPNANYLLCVKSDMPVLTSDLRWVPARELAVGDGILGCEEYAQPGRGNSRRYETGVVTNNRLAPMECVDVRLSNGDVLTVTPQHPILTQNKKGETKWVEAQHLRAGWTVHRYLDVWGSPQTFDAGWMSGFLDGEGCVSRIGHGIAVTLSQNPGPVLDEAKRIAWEHGFTLRDTGRGEKCEQHVVAGGKAEALRFLGTFQNHRLTPKMVGLIQASPLRSIEAATVESVEPAGVHEVSILGTSTSTFMGAGYAQHNSYDLPWSAGKLDQRNARIIRLSSEFDKVTLTYMLMHGSVEERQYDMLRQKQAIASAVVDGKGYDRKTGRLELTLKGLSEFLATSEV